MPNPTMSASDAQENTMETSGGETRRMDIVYRNESQIFDSDIGTQSYDERTVQDTAVKMPNGTVVDIQEYKEPNDSGYDIRVYAVSDMGSDGPVRWGHPLEEDHYDTREEADNALESKAEDWGNNPDFADRNATIESLCAITGDKPFTGNIADFAHVEEIRYPDTIVDERYVRMPDGRIADIELREYPNGSGYDVNVHPMDESGDVLYRSDMEHTYFETRQEAEDGLNDATEHIEHEEDPDAYDRALENAGYEDDPGFADTNITVFNDADEDMEAKPEDVDGQSETRGDIYEAIDDAEQGADADVSLEEGDPNPDIDSIVNTALGEVLENGQSEYDLDHERITIWQGTEDDSTDLNWHVDTDTEVPGTDSGEWTHQFDDYETREDAINGFQDKIEESFAQADDLERQFDLAGELAEYFGADENPDFLFEYMSPESFDAIYAGIQEDGTSYDRVMEGAELGFSADQVAYIALSNAPEAGFDHDYDGLHNIPSTDWITDESVVKMPDGRTVDITERFMPSGGYDIEVHPVLADGTILYDVNMDRGEICETKADADLSKENVENDWENNYDYASDDSAADKYNTYMEDHDLNTDDVYTGDPQHVLVDNNLTDSDIKPELIDRDNITDETTVKEADGRTVDVTIHERQDGNGYDVSAHPVLADGTVLYNLNMETEHCDTQEEAASAMNNIADHWEIDGDSDSYDSTMQDSAFVDEYDPDQDDLDQDDHGFVDNSTEVYVEAMEGSAYDIEDFKSPEPDMANQDNNDFNDENDRIDSDSSGIDTDDANRDEWDPDDDFDDWDSIG